MNFWKYSKLLKSIFFMDNQVILEIYNDVLLTEKDGEQITGKLKLEILITGNGMGARSDGVCNRSRHVALPVKNRVKY